MAYLVKWEAAKRAIIEAHSVDEVKQIRDQAEAYRHALVLAKESPEVIRKAEEIKLRAERRAGQILKETEKQKPGDYKRSKATTVPPTLKEIGITKDQSSKWQRIADIPEEKFEAFIEVEKELTTSGALRVERQQYRENRLYDKIELPEGEYDLIYADPPWRYEFSETVSREIENKYPTMNLEEIKSLKVPSAKNSILFLWTTAPKTEESIEVMNAWGFKYRTNACWDKQKIGMGYWFRGQHELLLVGIKGDFKTPLPENRYSSMIYEKRGRHSKKPKIVYDMLERMFPVAKKIELFSREKREGWDRWGNE